MSFKLNKYILIIGAMTTTLILAPNVRAEKGVYPDMFQFAKTKLKIEQFYETPVVHLVSQETIAELWRYSIRMDNSKYRLSPEQEKVAYTELLGLYSPKADIIHVLRKLKLLYRAVTIVHEYVHWLQVHHVGRIYADDPDAGMKVMFREMQAEQIGADYLEMRLKGTEDKANDFGE